ncbi:hypothetical protein [Myceligenerans crystallogenes]|uniref:Uncharacterized protein n=1 Tax=Myceligenerans crystallogenes TaxID=316335 RepID=A0ABN2N4C7_9MICO
MRKLRFQSWITELVDASLPPQIKRIEWEATGVNKDAGMGDQCVGLVFESPDGGSAYLRFVYGGGPLGDNPDEPEREPVTGEPPAPVAPVELALSGDRLRMADLEAWITSLILNAQHPEVRSVELFSEREQDPRSGFSHPFGFSLKWHDGDSVIGFFQYTLARGERRSKDTEYRIKEAV